MYVAIYLFLISLFSVNICYLLSILGTFHNYKHFPSRVVVRIRELCGVFFFWVVFFFGGGGGVKKIIKLCQADTLCDQNR